MTKKRAERLTGYEIRRLPEHDSKGRLAYGAFSGEELIVQCSNCIEEVALQAVVREVYELHSIQVLEQHGWRCARCRAPDACKFIIAVTGLMEELIQSTTWNQSAGTATS